MRQVQTYFTRINVEQDRIEGMIQTPQHGDVSRDLDAAFERIEEAMAAIARVDAASLKAVDAEVTKIKERTARLRARYQKQYK